MGSKSLHIGYDRLEEDKKVELPISALKRHFAALGSSGSGKTVLVKAVMEECVRNDIPLIMVDLQGDLASLAMTGKKEEIEAKKTPGKYLDDYREKAQVAIYTPASSKGIPISMNPLKAPPLDMDREDYIQAVDSVAETVTNIIGHTADKGKGLEIKNYLYLLLKSIWDEGEELGDFDSLAEAIHQDEDHLNETSREMISERVKDDVSKSIKGLTIGADSLIFNLGMGLDVERMLTWQDKGKTPVNVLYLNTLRSREDKINFIADASNQVYNWMLRNPSDDVQLVYILDELAGLVPPIRNPPSKKSIQLLLKQARKYGVSLLLATQNISDVDYKSLGQVSTWALGKLLAKQDIDKVKDIIQAISPAETDEILNILPKQTVGQFMLLNPDIYDSVQRIKVRWLVTNHTTIDDIKVKQLMDKTGIREKFPEAIEEDEDRSERRGDGSPMAAEDTAEVLSEEEINPAEKDVAVPSVSKSSDILPHLENTQLALSVEDLAQRTGEREEEVKEELEKLAKDKKLDSYDDNGVKIYWSAKHKMDPENNIIGPLFQFRTWINKGKAYDIMKNNIPKILMIKSTEKIIEKKSGLKYIPLWQIGVVERIEKGGILGFGKKEEDIHLFYYVNGIDGTILNIRDKKNKGIEFVSGSQIVDPVEEITTLDDQYEKTKIFLEDLMEDFIKPKISRSKAISLIDQFTPGMVNRGVVPSLCWMPIWEFFLKDKDMGNNRKAWIDGMLGGYMEEDPTQ